MEPTLERPLTPCVRAKFKCESITPFIGGDDCPTPEATVRLWPVGKEYYVDFTLAS